MKPTIKGEITVGDEQEPEAEHFCPKCGCHWMTHNDDGSCVDDEYEERMAKIREQ